MNKNIKIKNFPAFHGTYIGELENNFFYEQPTFFADKAEIAAAYAEHSAYNDHYEDFDVNQYNYPITIYPVLLTFENPVITSREVLFEIGRNIGIKENHLTRFADEFEDSEANHRTLVFDYIKQHGYDSIIMPNDAMPYCAGGDWDLQASYIALYPSRQVKFKLIENNITEKNDFKLITNHIGKLRTPIESTSVTIDQMEYYSNNNAILKLL